MENWRIKRNDEYFPLSLHPFIHAEDNQQDMICKPLMPNVHVSVRACSMKEGMPFSNKVFYHLEDVVAVEFEVENKGEDEVSRIVVSHMIRDHLSYVPHTLKVSTGEGELLFRLVRWRIERLLPRERTQLSFQIRADRYVDVSVSLRATYTFQHKKIIYGPFQTKDALLLHK